MKTYIVSDHEPTTAQVRESLLRGGVDCPASHILSLDLAPEHLGQAQPDLVVVAVAPDPERALAVVGQLRQLHPAPLLAVGPARDSRLVLRALRAGASDYVD